MEHALSGLVGCLFVASLSSSSASASNSAFRVMPRKHTQAYAILHVLYWAISFEVSKEGYWSCQHGIIRSKWMKIAAVGRLRWMISIRPDSTRFEGRGYLSSFRTAAHSAIPTPVTGFEQCRSRLISPLARINLSLSSDKLFISWLHYVPVLRNSMPNHFQLIAHCHTERLKSKIKSQVKLFDCTKFRLAESKWRRKALRSIVSKAIKLIMPSSRGETTGKRVNTQY
jgi:hypothetical protein